MTSIQLIPNKFPMLMHKHPLDPQCYSLEPETLTQHAKVLNQEHFQIHHQSMHHTQTQTHKHVNSSHSSIPPQRVEHKFCLVWTALRVDLHVEQTITHRGPVTQPEWGFTVQCCCRDQQTVTTFAPDLDYKTSLVQQL